MFLRSVRWQKGLETFPLERRDGHGAQAILQERLCRNNGVYQYLSINATLAGVALALVAARRGRGELRRRREIKTNQTVL